MGGGCVDPPDVSRDPAVVIEERQPIGIGRITGTLYPIDKTGTVIDGSVPTTLTSGSVDCRRTVAER